MSEMIMLPVRWRTEVKWTGSGFDIREDQPCEWLYGPKEVVEAAHLAAKPSAQFAAYLETGDG